MVCCFFDNRDTYNKCDCVPNISALHISWSKLIKKNLGYVFLQSTSSIVEMFHFFKTRQPFLAAELAAAKMPSATLLLTLLD